MQIILSIVLGTLLLFGHAVAAEQQQTTKDVKSQKEKSSAGEQQKGKKDLQSPKEKLSYSLGYVTGNRMRTDSVDLDPDIFMKAFKEAYTGKQAPMTDEEMRAAMEPLQQAMRAKQAEEMRKMAEKRGQMAEKNKEESAAFLAENGKKEGVVTLPSGLQYKIIKEGEGKIPQQTDKVEVNYRGTLIDGTEFDSSHKRGKPAVFEVGKVIKGWTEALLLMKEGSHWMLYIPSDLAYGPRGAGNMIGPNQTLIFDVELISIQQQNAEKQGS